VPSGQVAAWEHTTQSLARQLERAEDIAQECAAADAAYQERPPADDVFAPRPGPQCGWCDFRAHCAEGSAAAQSRLPWDGLAPRAAAPAAAD